MSQTPRSPALRVHQYARNNSWVVAAEGELDAETLAPLQQALEEAAATRPVVVFDASAVPFADSSTLNLLLRIHRTTTLRIAAAQPQLLRVLEITGADMALALFPSLTDACKAAAS
ncbi:STAS domain-containing protein [Streptomyces xanthochromogenes]|uniref:STAS domain-containing protein n=1 Tax=Streptomyces TaxID=1883 RepID=UPI00136D7316|nr:STAS domain-containing protein [Streptomyces sp. SID1034]MYV95579.1 STAS domain-containing protein [Streptomyces sp. SID1034]